MSSNLLQFVLVACSLMLLASARKMTIEREALIDAAIQEVKREVTHIQKTKLSKAQQMLKAFKMASPESRAHGMAAYRFERMVNLAERKILKSQRQAIAQTSSMAEALAMELFHKSGSILTGEEIAKVYEESECAEVIHPPPDCDSTAVQKHRTADGTCNNLENPILGAAGTPLRRLIPARYDDGISVPRGFLQSQSSPLISGGPFDPPLPSSRVCSMGIVQDRPVNDTVHTHILMQWGQFMDHDLDLIPEFEECPDECEVSPEDVGMCYPFFIPEDDDDILVTLTESDRCQQFRRSLPVCPPEDPPFTESLVRQHLNAITHYIDGSMVYHHDPEVQDNLIRDPDSDSGMLRTGDSDPGDPVRFLLPDITPAEGVVICPPESPATCFLAGDLRVNEQSALTVMHTIWVREHNRIAQAISEANPGYPSNKVFLTAREIVSAEIQKITYKDYLPRLFGESSDQLIPPYDLTEGYDPEVDPSVPNAFAAAAYRFGHSQIQPSFERLNTNYESISSGPLPLNSAFFNTTAVRTDGVGPILRGLVAKSARNVDEFLNSVLTNNLFAEDDDTPGLDLASLNLQRGRDHGLPPYLIWKQWAKTECDLESDFVNELTEIGFYQVYGSLENVDLFVGGLAERPLEGGVVGAVFACIFAQTFLALRQGDRFYYENPTGAFTASQIAEIEKTTLSRVICDNSDTTQIQPNAFLIPSSGNSRVNCDTLPSVDLSAWADNEATITGDCYARVSSGSSISLIAVSQRNSNNMLHFHLEPISGGSHICAPILCPESATDSSDVSIFTFSFCSHESNVNLPPSSSIFSRSYYNPNLDSQLFAPSNGFYATEDECNGASVDAVSFSCFASTTVQDTSGVIDTDTTPDGARELSNNDGAVNEFLGDGKSVSKQDHLVSLMEEVLQTLQAQTNSEKETKKAEVKQESKENTQLVSELEKLLQKVK